MAVETQTGQAKKKLVDAMRADLGDDATKALTRALEIFQALSMDAKGVDQGVVTACKGWRRHLDKMLQDISDEVSGVTKRMGGNTSSLPNTKTVVVDQRGGEE
tara:strand:- start:1339 stop:1647 length:309 start_codon:yes stop_codon:yes gene_type:complete